MSSEIVRTLAALVAPGSSAAGSGRSGRDESSEGAESAAVQPDGGTAAVDSSVPDATAPERSPVESFPKNFHQILHLTKAPMFVTDAEGEVLVWNQGMEELTGSDEAAARAADQISTAWYHDGRRSMTLADKIIDTNPGRREEATPTDEEYDVERVGWVDYELYQDESTFTDAEGTTRHIRFSAAPLYEDGRFVGVVEYVEDRTEDVRRQQDLERLVTELTETLTAVGSGDLGARADSLDLSHVDDRLAGVTESLNDTVSRLEEFVAETAADSEELQSSTEGIAARAESINDAAAEQLSSLRDVSDEVENTSASAEEIAATTDEVSANAAEAVEEAQAGDEAATAADETMQDVAESTEQVVTDVRSLQERMEEIDEVIEVINGIAEQTNMLALNASIEAARAGEAGEGFAVVADEIKQLATESQRHADDIEAMITSIRDDTERTVDSLFTVSDQVHTAREEVDRVQRSIDTVVDEIETTADGIEQVATVTDEQAATSEEVASMIGDVVEAAEAIADDTDTIAAQNQAHADLADRIDRNLEQLTGDR